MKLLNPCRSFALAAGLLVGGLAAPAAAGEAAASSTDWPRWRGPSNDGISTETGWKTEWPKDGPKVLWKISVGQGFSSVAVVGGRVYTMGNAKDTDTVWCLDAATGKEIWTHRYACPKGGHPGSRMTPTVDGDRVFTLSREGQLFALAAADGKVLWSKDIKKDFGAKQTEHDWGFASSPLVLGDKLILDVGKCLALEKATGKLIWSSGDDLSGFSSATLTEVGGVTYINCFTAFGLVLVDAKTGKEVARAPWETSYEVNAASPIASGSKIFVSSGYGKGCGLFELKGSSLDLVYESKKMRNHCNSCVLLEGHVYGLDGQMGDGRGTLACLDFETGKEVWRQKGFPAGGLVAAGGKLVIMANGGDLVVADASPSGYKERARAKILDGQCWTAPVVSGGKIYCRSNEQGQLACVDVGGK
jgi:outer membrane protein assembly factor BamB